MINRKVLTEDPPLGMLDLHDDERMALQALIRWADEARAELEDALTLSRHYDHGMKQSPLTERLAALLAEWPKEADRG